MVKLSGKKLSHTIYKLILYIEESQKPKLENTQSKKRTVDTSTLKTKVLRETRLIPKVVYEMEQFSKSVIQLSKKTNIDLSVYIGQGTTRDFRILHLKEVLAQTSDPNSHNESCLEVSHVESQKVSNTQNEVEDNFSESENEENFPPAKKLKT